MSQALAFRLAINLPDPGARGKKNPPWVAIHRVADRRMDRMAKTIEKAVKAAQDILDIKELGTALETRIPGNVDAVLGPALVVLETTLYKPLEKVLFGILAEAGEAVAKDTRKYGKFRTAETFKDLRFDLVNPEATAWASGKSSQLVTNITSDTRQSIQAIIASMFDEGVSGPGAARLIRQHIGLTPQYSNAVLSLRKHLGDPRNAGKKIYAGRTPIRIPKTGADVAFIERRAGRYAQRLLNVRTRTIARTEGIAAANQGQIQLWKQATKEGLLFGNELKEWIVTPDDRLCPICEPLDRELAPLKESFSIGLDSPPAHPNCRCTTGLADPDYLSQPGRGGGKGSFNPKQYKEIGAVAEHVLQTVGGVPKELGKLNFYFSSDQAVEVGGRAFYQYQGHQIHLNVDASEDVVSLMFGQKNEDAFRGLNTLVHEIGHAGSQYPRMKALGESLPEWAILWEEAVVETRSRKIAAKMLFPKKAPSWVKTASTSYNKEVRSMEFLLKNGIKLDKFYAAAPAERLEMVVGVAQKVGKKLLKSKGFQPYEIERIFGILGSDAQHLIRTHALTPGQWGAMSYDEILEALEKDYGVLL